VHKCNDSAKEVPSLRLVAGILIAGPEPKRRIHSKLQKNRKRYGRVMATILEQVPELQLQILEHLAPHDLTVQKGSVREVRELLTTYQKSVYGKIRQRYEHVVTLYGIKADADVDKVLGAAWLRICIRTNRAVLPALWKSFTTTLSMSPHVCCSPSSLLDSMTMQSARSSSSTQSSSSRSISAIMIVLPAGYGALPPS